MNSPLGMIWSLSYNQSLLHHNVIFHPQYVDTKYESKQAIYLA